MNARVLEHRKEKKKINYDTTVMPRLVQTQNKIIQDELLKLGLDLSRLQTKINIAGEMTKRSEAAYAAVKARVDKAKRAEGNRLAVSNSGGSGGAGAGGRGGSVTVGGKTDSVGSSLSSASSNGSVASAVVGAVPGGPSVAAAAVSAATVPVTSSAVQPGRPEVELVQPQKVRVCCAMRVPVLC